MKKIWTKVLCVLVSVVVLAACIHKLGFLLENKLAYQKMGEFIATGEEYDVLFLGTSHMAMGIYPMELWEDYGIASYNLAGNGHPMASSYWVMMNAFDYAEPQLVVIDCYTVERNEKVPGDGKFTHESLDEIPLSLTKVRAVCDLFDDTDCRMEYLWNFSMYHNCWSELKKDDFTAEYGLGKGAYYNDIVELPKDVSQIDKKSDMELDSVGTLYLEKMIEECQRRNIDVLLTYVPFPAQEEEQLEARAVNHIAEKYRVNYINFLERSDVNYNTDCYDPASHLNASGARKVTQYLGNYIQTEYGIPDHRGEAEYDHWNEDYSKYSAYKVERLQSKESLKPYLMLLADKRYSYCLWVDKDTRIWSDDPQYRDLVYNLALGKDLQKLPDAIEQQEDYFVVVDNSSEKVWECFGDEALDQIDTSFGTLTYSTEEENGKLYFNENEEDYIIEQYEDEGAPEIQIIVIDNANGSIVDVARFDESLKLSRKQN